MKIAITGGTGFVGRALVKRLVKSGHELRCLHRPTSDLSGFSAEKSGVDWLEGSLGSDTVAKELCHDVDVVVHSALWRTGKSFRDWSNDVIEFARINILGSLQLIEAARNAGVSRFVFVSTCAVHEKILDDRPLDETHPLWPLTHYGAHKAAIEKFVHSYGHGMGYPICAIRPTGIYGVQYQAHESKWFGLVEQVVTGQDVTVQGGGKEVHVDDVAKAIEVAINAPTESITGEAFACYDRYISRFEVATLAKELTGSESEITGEPKSPKHQIVTDKIKKLGMTFGGDDLLRSTVKELVGKVQSKS